MTLYETINAKKDRFAAIQTKADDLMNTGHRLLQYKRALMCTVFPILIMSCLVTLPGKTIFAAEANDIVGLWSNEEKDGKIRIYQCGKEYCGAVVWTKRGAIADTKNPNPGLRNRQIIGLVIMHGFRYAGDGEWRAGAIYDPKSGKTYRGKMWLATPDRLDMRGYVVIPLFGRTTSWTRLSDVHIKDTSERTGQDLQK